MYLRPDYSSVRERAGFSWSVTSSQGALREITGTPIREFYLDPEACIHAYRQGRPLIQEMFGPDVAAVPLSTPHISYGHVNGLGSELVFPEGGEVAHTHIYASLEEGLRRLKEPVDFAHAGMAPFYLEFRRRMSEAFNGEPVHFGFNSEGPITTAYALRGDGFFMDILDDPPLAREFLRAVVRSTLDYHRFVCSLDGHEPVSPDGAGMVDDLSSLIPPRLWPEMVLPFWEQYYGGLTTGTRSAHVENLTADHLPFLEDIGLSFYDPSISPKLHPGIIRERCRVPFLWRLENFHLREMSCEDVEDFVYQAVADGASSVVTAVAETMCNERGVAQVHAFIRAAKQAQRMLQEGATRAEVGELVSPAGRETLWEAWCGFAGPRSSRGRGGPASKGDNEQS